MNISGKNTEVIYTKVVNRQSGDEWPDYDFVLKTELTGFIDRSRDKPIEFQGF